MLVWHLKHRHLVMCYRPLPDFAPVARNSRLLWLETHIITETTSETLSEPVHKAFFESTSVICYFTIPCQCQHVLPQCKHHLLEYSTLCRKVRSRRVWGSFNTGPTITVTTCNFEWVIIPVGSSHHCLLCAFGSCFPTALPTDHLSGEM